jgi:hypothetical protein
MGALMLLGAGVAAAWLALELPLPLCFFKEWTGLPCPTCGTTRIVEALLAGRLLEAASINPLVFAGMAGLALWAVVSTTRWLFGLPTWRVSLAPGESRLLLLLAGAAVGAGWVYLIARGG